MITSRQEQKTSVTPDLTPLLDLVFIVMVFLLLTTNIQIKTMDVHIPQTEASSVLSALQKEVITINILPTQEAGWAIQGERYSDWSLFSAELLNQIKAAPDKTVIIAADKAASVEAMLKLLAFLQNNQINATNIVMEDNPS